MCGVAGFYHFNSERQVNKYILKRMTDCISHRGPYGEGSYCRNNVALGHRRLSIIDLSTGDQPMYSDDVSIVLIFNGEIYFPLEPNHTTVKIQMGKAAKANLKFGWVNRNRLYARLCFYF
jgi:asparagine synthetase B (glutamine-hydrolysing)